MYPPTSKTLMIVVTIRLKKIFAKTHNKNGLGNDYYEVSVIVHGCIELLAIVGIVAINGEPIETFWG